MDQFNQYTIQDPEYKFRADMDFEDYFNKDIISREKINYSRHYLEDKMGLSLVDNSYLDLSAIDIKLFGCLLVDVVLEYENFKETMMDE